ncbi:MAG: hypothetical protein AB8E82_01910 [Aureispira sp.]
MDEQELQPITTQQQINQQEGSSTTTTPTNDTSIPDNMKAAMEYLSGISLDAVQVHYNSEKPAEKNLSIYSEGTDVYVAPNAENELGKELLTVMEYLQQQEETTPPLLGAPTVGKETTYHAAHQNHYDIQDHNQINFAIASTDEAANQLALNFQLAQQEKEQVSDKNQLGGFFFSNQGVFLGKHGDSTEIRIVNPEYVATVEAFFRGKNNSFKEQMNYFIPGSYASTPLTDASNQLFSKIATQIFLSTKGLKIQNLKLYKNKISVMGNNAPKYLSQGIAANWQTGDIANSWYYNDEIGGVINLMDKKCMGKNYYNLINTMVHEQEHNRVTKDLGREYNNTFTHLDIYEKEQTHSSWNQTDELYKKNSRGSLIDYINQATIEISRMKKTGHAYHSYYEKKITKTISSYEKRFDTKLEYNKNFHTYKDPRLE